MDDRECFRTPTIVWRSLFDHCESAQDILEHEPEILRSEVEESLKSAKTGKAPGIDGISIEIINAAGEAGVELLWRVCRAVWKDGKAVETVHNNTYMETERRQKRMLSV